VKIEEICTIAKSHSINPSKLSKTELIKSIQTNEGNYDCFSTAYGGACDQVRCSWREDCFDAALKVELS
jgi:hypothetical protein